MATEYLSLSSSTGRTPTVTLHLLVKDGEAVVGRLLDHVGPHVDELVAVLDHCSDGTAEVLHEGAARHGLRCLLLSISPHTHPWLYFRDVPSEYEGVDSYCGESFPGPFSGELMLGDFAGARGVGWKLGTCGWQLVLDADDVVEQPEVLRSVCRSLEDRGIDAAASRYYHSAFGGAPVVRERLARAGVTRWEGVVHERMVGYAPGRVACLDDCLAVRDLRDSLVRRDRFRNLKILYRRARQLDFLLDPTESLYLASEAVDVMPDLAGRLAEDCLPLLTRDPERAWASAVRGVAAEGSGKAAEALDWYERSLGHHPTSEVAYRLARVAFVERRYEDVVYACGVGRACAGELLPCGLGGLPLAEGSGVLLAASLFELGRRDEALQEARAYATRHPQNVALQALLQKMEA